MAGIGDTSWLPNARYGIFMHYQYRILLGYSVATNPQFPQPSQMTASQWNQFINGFDVNDFASQMAQGGVGWVLFCLDDCYFGWQCAPNTTFDNYTGYAPRTKCSNRDLILDLAPALQANGVKLILYYAGMSGYISDPQSLAGFGGDNNYNTAPSASSCQKHIAALTEYANRYTNLIAGWWFDDFIATDEYTVAPYDYRAIASAVHAANPKSIIAFSGNGEFSCHQPGVDDYTAGDTWSKQDLTALTPQTQPAADGIFWEGKIYCGNIYYGQGTSNQYTDQYLINWVTTCNRQGGVVCMDWPFDSNTGLIKGFGMTQLTNVAGTLKAIKANETGPISGRSH